MENKQTYTFEEDELMATVPPTWEKVLRSEKEEFEATKCSFKAKEHDRCCKTVMDFTISRIISENDLTNIYEVEDTATKEHFAVKIYEKRDEQFYQDNEIRILTILRDIEGYFVRCEHLFTTKTHNIIVLELLVPSFFNHMEEHKKVLCVEMARVFANKLAKMIAILHAKGIIYADLKPENIMIDKSGDLKLIDFHSSYIQGEEIDFEPLGSILYMAPEQASDEIEWKSDWYAFGSIIWESLSLKIPNLTYLNANGIDEKSDPSGGIKKISEIKEDIKLEAITESQKAALPFVKECIRVKVEDRIDLDKAGTDFENVEFLKDVTAEHYERFNEEMLRNVEKAMKTISAFLLIY